MNKIKTEAEYLQIMFFIVFFIDQYVWAILRVPKTHFFSPGKLDTFFIKLEIIRT